jgi:DNA-binding response OmpR family regulator
MKTKPSAPQTTSRILLAEDDEQLRDALARLLREDGYEVTECGDGLRLREHLNCMLLSPEVLGRDPERFDVIVSDVRMPGATGLAVLEGVQLFEELPPMILITGFGNEETHVKAKRWGAVATLDKPFAAKDLLAKVHEIAPPRPSLPL